VATDSYILFGVKAAGPKQGKEYPKSRLEDLLTGPPSEPKVFVVEDLKEWAGEAPSKLIPLGDVDYEHQGVLLGHVVDLRKLAYLLAKVTLPEIRGWVVEKGLLAFEPPKGQWRALLSTLEELPDGGEPVFRDSLELAAMLEGE
jgi:hypothetical protein